MGLLDWLSDAIGSSNGSGGNMLSEGMPMGNPTSGMPAPQPTGPMPPVQPTGQDAAPMQPPPPPPSMGGIGSDAVGAPGQPPLPPSPAPAPASAMPAPPPPPPMQPPGGGLDANAAVKSYQGAGGTFAPPPEGVPGAPGAPANPQARGMLGRALGLDPNMERRVRAGIGGALSAAGNSAGKSPFQALASGAGAGLQAGDKADDKTTADQQKYLAQAVAAAQSGDTRALKQAQTQLALAQTKMTLQGKMGKDSVMNSDQQLYLRGLGAIHSDPAVAASAAGVRAAQTQYGPDSTQAKDAMAKHSALIDDTKKRVLGTLGVDEKTFDKMGKKPGMSEQTALPAEKVNSQEAFDKLPPGTFFKNPADGKVLMKPMKGIGAAAAGTGPNGAQPAGAPAPGGQNLPAGQGGVPAPTSPNLPPLPPQIPTSPVASADDEGSEAVPDDESKEAA